MSFSVGCTEPMHCNLYPSPHYYDRYPAYYQLMLATAIWLPSLRWKTAWTHLSHAVHCKLFEVDRLRAEIGRSRQTQNFFLYRHTSFCLQFTYFVYIYRLVWWLQMLFQDVTFMPFSEPYFMLFLNNCDTF